MLKDKRALFLLPLILFFFLVASELVERSMYTDGVAYAGLSMNMANGVGTFWNPKLSEIHHFSFHEHPPLVFGVQSLFFRVFGDSIVSERIFAFSIFALSAWLMVLLWRESLRDWAEARKLWFLPLTVWLANEIVYHYYPANVLEPTMILFTLGAVYCCLRGAREGTGKNLQAGLTVLAGLLIFAATLSKGFVALFPLAFYGIYWLVYSRMSLLRAAGLTALMTGVVLVSYAILLQYEPARTSLSAYFDSQVLASLSSERSYERHFRSSRFYIVERGLAVLLPSFLLCSLLLVWARAKGFRRSDRKPGTNAAFLFLSLGLAASLPLMVSPKQAFYYLLPSMAYFALGFALYVLPEVTYLWNLKLGKTGVRILTGVIAALLLASLINTASHWGQITRRDRVVVNDITEMQRFVPEGATIGAVGDVADMVSYFFRFHGVSLDTTVSKAGSYDYFIARPEVEVGPYGGEVVPLETERYLLYRRR